MRRPAAPPIVNFIVATGDYVVTLAAQCVRLCVGGRADVWPGRGGVEPRQVCAYVRCDSEPIMLHIGIWQPDVVMRLWFHSWYLSG